VFGSVSDRVLLHGVGDKLYRFEAETFTVCYISCCFFLDSTELQESAYKYQLLGLNLLRLLAQNKLGDFHTVRFFDSLH